MMVMNGNEQLDDAVLTAVSARRVGNRPGRQMKPRNEHFRRVKSKAVR
jgi:hypothetical protein